MRQVEPQDSRDVRLVAPARRRHAAVHTYVERGQPLLAVEQRVDAIADRLLLGDLARPPPVQMRVAAEPWPLTSGGAGGSPHEQRAGGVAAQHRVEQVQDLLVLPDESTLDRRDQHPPTMHSIECLYDREGTLSHASLPFVGRGGAWRHSTPTGYVG